MHFEMALDLTHPYFHKANAIDFGCGDGAFLPSLSKYFSQVTGIDKDPNFFKIASSLVNSQGMGNVELLCNDSMSFQDMKSHLSAKDYSVLYLLETLEHVGNKDKLFESKIDFLHDLFTLVRKDGVIVISVPIMVGAPFLIQRIGLALTNSYRESISFREIIKSVLFGDTATLENRWNGGHLGFNHIKLEQKLNTEFHIIKKINLLFQVIYLIKEI